MQRYNPKDIEPKWQKIWDETGVYTTDLESKKPKYLAMSMFNYPSGAGIHIGHAMNYTISDVKARFKRQQGFESYHPVGWDAFGLPAENFAIKSGVSPQESMANIIPGYHKQYKAMGWSNDWEKEIATHLPEYYKWTQWIFSEMFRNGLAYQDSRMQWWCAKDNTVLANEQVIDGKCWRHDAPDDPLVEKREIKQWFFKITDYADELLEAIEGLDWTDSVKLAQKNWIGKSTGAEVEFVVGDSTPVIKDTLKFTPSLTEMIQRGDKWSTIRLEAKGLQVGDYAKLITRFDKDTVRSFAVAKIKNVEVKRLGDIANDHLGHATYASDDEKLADYKGYYGDEVTLDTEFTIYEFEKTNDIITVFTTAYETIYGTTFVVLAPEHELVDSVVTDEQRSAVDAYKTEALKKTEVQRQQEGREKTGVFTGSYAMNPVTGKAMPIWVADYALVGYGTGAVMGSAGEDERDYEFAQKFGLDIVYTTEQQEFVEYTDIKAAPKNYKLAKSGEFDGMDFAEARPKILEKLTGMGVATAKVNYRMRDWSVSRQRYWGAPIPIVHCEKCGNVLIPDEQLPVVLPELDDFAPSGDGRSALARAADWLNVECPECGGPAERETDTLDTYICSSWYFYRYMDPHNTQQAFAPEQVKKWEPVDFYNGADHATAHLLYARFIGHFFKRIGLVDEPEPFKQFLFNGKVTAADGQMFSKSKGNGVDPLDIIEQGYGADALRTYLMFAAPLEIWARWDPQGVPGTHRFLSRIWSLVGEYNEAKPVDLTDEQQRDIRRSVHVMIRKMTEDIEENRYNTAIAASMTCVNDLYKLKTKGFGQHAVWHEALMNLVACVAPFAPHIAEELWFQLGNHLSIHRDSWPKWDEQYLATDTVTIAVQVNGKLRGTIAAPTDSNETAVTEQAKADGKIAANLDGKQIVKVIYVPGKLLNFVVK